jgi:hypothetical protein
MYDYDDNRAAVMASAGAISPLVDLLRGGQSAEQGGKYAATALYNLTSLDAERRQVAGLGYTRYWITG